ncbi:unnamed protein product [Gadus morhua 'NCC']
MRGRAVLSLEVLSLEVLSLELLSLELLSLEVLSLEVLSLEVLSLEVLSLERLSPGGVQERDGSRVGRCDRGVVQGLETDALCSARGTENHSRERSLPSEERCTKPSMTSLTGTKERSVNRSRRYGGPDTSPTKSASFSPETWYRRAYEESRGAARPAPEGAGSMPSSTGTPSPGSGTSSPGSFSGSPGTVSPGIGTGSPGSLGGSPGFGTGSPASGSGSSPGSERGGWCEDCSARLEELKGQALTLLIPGPCSSKRVSRETLHTGFCPVAPCVVGAVLSLEVLSLEVLSLELLSLELLSLELLSLEVLSLEVLSLEVLSLEVLSL